MSNWQGPTRPWVLRTSAEDKAEAQRQHDAKADALFSSEAYIKENQELAEAETSRLKSMTQIPDDFESALYGEFYTPPLRLTNGQYRRGIRNPEEDMR